jgi:hypothetical protein
MIDPPSDSASDEKSGTPRWVKVSGLVALAVILLLVIALLSGGGHGPGRHMEGSDIPSPTLMDRSSRGQPT